MTQMLFVLLMASPSGQAPNSSFSLIMMGAIILVFWLFMIRPQAKKAKDQKKKKQLDTIAKELKKRSVDKDI